MHLEINMVTTGATTDIITETPICDENSFLTMDIEDFIKLHNLPSQHIDFIDTFLLYPYVFHHNNEMPYIAGGYLRRWMQGEKLEDMTCDIDIYCRGKVYDHNPRENYKKFIKQHYEIETIDGETGFKNAKANIKFDNKTWEIQVMHHSFNIEKDKIKEHLKTYDSFSSMFLYDMSKRNMIFHKSAPEHAQKKIYEFNKECRSVSPFTQFQRIKKFATEGYSFTPTSDVNFLKWIADNKERINSTDNYKQ